MRHVTSRKRIEINANLLFSLVPGRGLEPPRCYPLVPETSASTNSATRAGAGRLEGEAAGSAAMYARGSGLSIEHAQRTVRAARPTASLQSRCQRPPHAKKRLAQYAAESRTPTARRPVLAPATVAEGTVSANRAGYGFVRVEGLKDSVFLPPPQMRGVMHGDRVRVRLARDSSDRWLGRGRGGARARRQRVPRHGRNAGAAGWVIAADRRLQLRCSLPARRAARRAATAIGSSPASCATQTASGPAQARDREAPRSGASGRAGDRVGDCPL